MRGAALIVAVIAVTAGRAAAQPAPTTVAAVDEPAAPVPTIERTTGQCIDQAMALGETDEMFG